MGFGATASNKEGGDYERPPVGMHAAYLVSLIDLGTHDSVYQGKTTEARKIFFVWELTDEKNKEDENFVVGTEFRLTLGKNSNLRPFLEGWIGKAFQDGEEYNPLELVGHPCVLTLTEGVSAAGKKFIEVASCAKPMKNTTVPPPTRMSYVFDLDTKSDDSDPGIPEWIPFSFGKKITEVIKASKEWGSLRRSDLVKTGPFRAPPCKRRGGVHGMGAFAVDGIKNDL